MDDEMIIYDTENGQYFVPLNLPLLEKMPEKVDVTKDYIVGWTTEYQARRNWHSGQLNSSVHCML